MTDVKKIAEDFRLYAEHFVQEDWNYTRDLGSLTSIRYSYPEDTLRGRIKDAWEWLVKGKGDQILRLTNFDGRSLLRARWSQAMYALKRDNHIPDGALDRGGILTVWEETGEYIQLVQPSVGSLVADFMEAEPENPHAIKIAAEMQRIQDNYAKRVEESKQ